MADEKIFCARLQNMPSNSYLTTACSPDITKYDTFMCALIKDFFLNPHFISLSIARELNSEHFYFRALQHTIFHIFFFSLFKTFFLCRMQEMITELFFDS